MKKTITQIKTKIANHTRKCLFDWCNHGYGTDTTKAIDSELALDDYVIDILNRVKNGEELP